MSRDEQHIVKGVGRFLLLGVILFGTGGCANDDAVTGDDSPQTTASLLRVQGNRIINNAGEAVVLRGLALADPDQLLRDGHWDAEYFRQAHDWGAKVVRIPIHPRYWRDRGPEAYLSLLDQGIEWSKQSNMYVILDWHSIGDLVSGVFDNSWGIYPTTLSETLDFWRRVARRYRNEPQVAFYEIFNEPTQYVDGRDTGTSWSQWRRIAGQIVAMICDVNPDAIAIVGGLDWAYDLQPVAADPVQHPNVVYAVHPYPQKRPEPWETYWEADFGALTAQYPVFATEFGFETAEQTPGGSVAVATVEYGRRIIRFLEERNISWTVWCFHPTWGPTLLADWNYTPTRPAGEFFRGVLLGQPSGTQ
jgi:endoglucanase